MDVLYAIEGDRCLEEVWSEHLDDTCRACASPPLSSGLLMGFDLRTLVCPVEPASGSSNLEPCVDVDEVMCALSRAARDEVPVDGVSAPPPGWDELVALIIDGGLAPLSAFLAAANRTPGLSLESAALTLLRSVVRIEGRDAALWSGSSRWVVANVTGFLSDDVACEVLPVGAFLTVQIPGIAPCLGLVLTRRCVHTGLDDSEVLTLLAREWTGSLADLLTVSVAL